ncbi:hypothetical protein DM860_005070 [Cuscuta australis]|uniref:Uncharacterized protein n=1 Tax=Cuscuta australis TaxID=267555 RepID=A0A328DRE0_9ASTE|nr:hypothetical protein DM860_005070 [Cuscuta australis]
MHLGAAVLQSCRRGSRMKMLLHDQYEREGVHGGQCRDCGRRWQSARMPGRRRAAERPVNGQQKRNNDHERREEMSKGEDMMMPRRPTLFFG